MGVDSHEFQGAEICGAQRVEETFQRQFLGRVAGGKKDSDLEPKI